jgi:hypothetical protein
VNALYQVLDINPHEPAAGIQVVHTDLPLSASQDGRLQAAGLTHPCPAGNGVVLTKKYNLVCTICLKSFTSCKIREIRMNFFGLPNARVKAFCAFLQK